MKYRNPIVTAAAVFTLMQVVSFAEDPVDKKIDLGGMVSFENGQFTNSTYAGAAIPYKPWVSKECARLSLRATLSERLQFIVAPQVMIWFDNYNWAQMLSEAFAFPFTSHTTVSLANAQGIMSFSGKEGRRIEFAAGVIPYKYNAEAKNLGEYLFRSGCHPAYVVTSFDNPYAPLTGFKLSSTLSKKFSLDMFLSSETVFLPTLDWSVSLLAAYRPFRSIELGGACMLDRILPVDSTRESPSSSTDGVNKYVTKDRDTGYFSFGGIKIMARFCFDPKETFGGVLSKNIFGTQDLKIYGEAAVLGVKSIVPYTLVLDDSTGLPVPNAWRVDSSKNFYDNILQRIPVMVGVNLPTFSGFLNKGTALKRALALDYLSLEAEWYGWPYPLGYGDVNNFRVMYPIPPSVQDYPGGDLLAFKKRDNLKFSVNFRKTVVNGFSIIGQVARDHTHYDVYYTKFNTGYFSSEAFTLPNAWGWWLKLQYSL